MSSGRKSISSYYSKVAPQTILQARVFLPTPGGCRRVPENTVMQFRPRRKKLRGRSLSATELTAALGCAATLGPAGSTPWAARTLVLVAENQSAFFEIVRRHFDGDPVP